MSDAIDDVSEENEPVNAGLERMQAMDEIADKRAQERDEELRAEGQEVIDTSGEETEEQTEEVETEETEEEQEPVKPDYIEGKVNGETVQFSKDELIETGLRTKQKETSADAKLEEASRILREAQQQAAELTPKPEPPSKDVVDYKEMANTLNYGSEEDIANVLQKVSEQGRDDTTLTPDQIAFYIDDKTAHQKAVDLLQTKPEDGGFSDIISDPMLEQIFIAKEREANQNMQANGDKRTYSQLYTDICTEIREWRDQSKPTVDKSFKEVEEKKKDLPTPIKSGSKRAVTSDDETPKTEEQRRQEALRDIRKSRHQTG